MPALLRALRLSEKAARAGFDWETTDQVFQKVREEISEWEGATQSGHPDQAAGELGDLLFSLVNVARRLGIEPEAALQSANQRFAVRFGRMEEALAEEGLKMEAASGVRLEELWEAAKRAEQA